LEPDSFAAWHAANPAVGLGTFAEAARHGEILFNATGGDGTLPALAADHRPWGHHHGSRNRDVLALWIRLMGALGTPLYNIKVVR